jgi:hypothetical protein
MQMSLQKGRENYSPGSLESDTPREGAAIGRGIRKKSLEPGWA